MGTLGYLVAAPAIHGQHDRLGTAFSSVGLRLGAPLIAGLIGVLIESNRCSSPRADDEIVGFSPCKARGGEISLFGAMIAASIFDIARASVAPGEHQWRPTRDSNLAWSPVVVPTSDGTTFGTTFGLAGRF